jgi:anti-anti-sigma factor
VAERFEVEQHGEYALIRVVQKFNFTAVRDFRVCWNEVVSKDLFRIILDMRGVEHMDSSGIGSVVMLRNFLDQNGGTLVLINSKNNICDLFDITGLKSIVNYVDDPEEAKKLVLQKGK